MNKYNLQNFLTRINGKDLVDVLITTEDEVRRIDAVFLKVKKNSDEFTMINGYRNLIGDFLFFLRSGAVPAGIGKQGLKKFETVIKSLVDQGCFKPTILTVFD